MEKITNKMALTYVVNNCDLPAEISGKLYSMIDALERKASRPKKLTPVQEKNEVYLADILTFLRTNAEQGFTCGELSKNVASLAEINASTSKVSALLSKLMKSGEIVRYELKRVAYFKAVTE